MTTQENPNAVHFHGDNVSGSLTLFRWTPESPIGYAIQVPASRTGELAEFLDGMGMSFSPELQVMAENRRLAYAVRFTGEDVPGLVERINDYLSSRKLQPVVPEDHDGWSIGRRHTLLTMAAQHFFWVERQDEPFFQDEVSRNGWDEITKEYAVVFGVNPS